MPSQSDNPPLLRLLGEARTADPERFARVSAAARSLRPGYPQVEAFSKGEIFSPQAAIRECKRAGRRLRMSESRQLVGTLTAFLVELDTRLQAEQGFRKEGAT
jgi:hypothetical protein